MGNCQAAEATSLEIQYPSGKSERFYWSISASDVMKMNPGYYVSLKMPTNSKEENRKDDKGVRLTCVKLLRTNETLVLGKAYRLVPTKDILVDYFQNNRKYSLWVLRSRIISFVETFDMKTEDRFAVFEIAIQSLEVMKVLKEKSHEKMRRSRRYSDYGTLVDPVTDSDGKTISENLEMEKTSQSMRHERYRQNPIPNKFVMTRSKSWCPSLKSISEGPSVK